MKILILLVASLTYANISFSEETVKARDTNLFLSLDYGKIAFFDHEFKNNNYGIELQKKNTYKWKLDSIYGATLSQDDNKYIYYGINKDWHIKGPFVFSSSLSVGLFDNNQFLDLGHTIEFRTKITIAYRFQNNHRLGVSIAHLSNSRLSSNNPGTETLNINYTFPLKLKSRR